MSGIVIEVCRAKKDDELQTLIGVATGYWKAMGYKNANVQYVSAEARMAGIYVREKADAASKKEWSETQKQLTAVVVMST